MRFLLIFWTLSMLGVLILYAIAPRRD